MDNVQTLATAIGRFHPLILHFPIGLIAGAACFELWMVIRPETQLRGAIGFLLVLASAGAVAAAVCGLLLARSGGYDDAILLRHRLFGLATAALAVAALALHRWSRRSSHPQATALYRLTLAACVVATAGAGHYGSIITHGSQTPVEGLIRALRGSGDRDEAQRATAAAATSDDNLFQQSVQPILQAHCYECHGPEKQKSGLRLDSRETALAGGESGKPAIVPGDAMASRLVEAITLPAGNKRAMPPDGKPRLEPAQVLVLIDWINRGALWPDKSQLRPAGVSAPSPAVLAQLRSEGFHLNQLAQGHPLVRVDAVPKGARLSALAPVAGQVGWLNLAGYQLTPGELAVLTDMPYLTRLELQRSNVQDGDLAYVAKVPHLAVVNLYGTRIGDPGLEHLHDLSSLEQLYLWETEVSAAGVEALHQALPQARIDRGGVDPDIPPTTTSQSPAA
jgi:uncharacterized membrane protein